MTALLDANVLIALTVADHVHRGIAALHPDVVILLEP